ncbi:sel1 repeat family protein [Gilliamella sp. B14384G15]|uniref:tetratricopeptide repeat protein n=1 Tax=unclassified Gilliamella TaxID=2685620 RepID=UPI0018DE73F4|nr:MULTISPECIES: sel1 repeat family protein [unclassified Gilliamella]MBI0030142.1 sel1 repeat family protein [Gilliamella sp. B14384G15]MBI0057298.1 sel1 repeat family protein [Gilliamella sp. B14384G12]
MKQQKTELKIQQRIEQLKKITRQDSKKKYAQAQLVLGEIYYKYKKDWQQAIKHFLNIKKQDNPEIYAKAQFCLGYIYQYDKNNKEKAEHCYLNVEKQDNPKVYAQAQLNLGVIYTNEKHDIEQAERCFLNVEKQDNPKAYAIAQFSLGNIYKKYNIKNAEHYYLNIEKQDNPELYAVARLILGDIYRKEKNGIEKSEHYYLNIEKQDNPELYAVAQFSLGNIYKKYNIKKAEHYYLNIEKQDNPELYAVAQLILGDIYREEKNDIEKSERYYLKVKKEDSSNLYAFAQLKLGNIYREEKNDIKKSERYYLKVEKEDSPKAYALAQCKLGDNVFFNKMQNKLKSSEEYYQNVAYSDNSFQSYIIAQVMLSVISNKNSSIFEEEQRNNLVVKICDIRKLTIEIQEELLVTFNLNESKNINGLTFERQVAHYTKPEVLFNLLKDKQKNKTSDFRLNVVDFMNDPTENQVLTDWLDVKTEKDNEIKTFLASFSFNHNSLNQFRLYGNENNIVGSSVSLVFDKKFFGDDINRSINPASINYFFNNADFGLAINDSVKSVVTTMGLNNSNENLNQKSDNKRNDLKENLDQKNSETVAEKNITSSVGSLPLFRCLYFDPKNGYISIAKRNKYSFYLEHQSDSAENIDAKWNNYLDSLNEEAKINTVREKLQQIEEIIHSLKNPEEPKQKEIIEKITNLDQLIALALMPISCLVKHAAFEDEDECRMFYITNIADELIQAPKDYAYANSLFVNYGKIEDYLEKIYLGPQCQPHHKLWITNHVRTSQSRTRSKPIKVVQSEMPLR